MLGKNITWSLFIPKQNSNKLRPISLANTLFKLLEKIVKGRLEWWLESIGALLAYQNGFRRGRSCANSVLSLKYFIKDAFKSSYKVGAIFVDIQSAFDNVNPIKLISMIRDLGVPRKIIQFISFILLNRTVTGYYNGRPLGTRKGSRGVPQGSVLSPLLFNVYISRVHLNLNKNTHILAYADDIVIFTRDKNIFKLSQTLDSDLDSLKENLSKLDLKISSSKTKWCIFYAKNRFSTLQTRINKLNLHVKIDDTIILSPHAVFLGYAFDTNLNWRTHVKKLKLACLSRINLLKSFAGIRWGAHPSTLLMVYKGLVRSLLN